MALKAPSAIPSANGRAVAQRGNGSRPAVGSVSAIPAERWFNEQLSRLYAQMLSEPLPEELMNLLEQMRGDKKSMREG